nr:MAG TPA: hypothetical protein [Caudoviricetes sp.]
MFHSIEHVSNDFILPEHFNVVIIKLNLALNT